MSLNSNNFYKDLNYLSEESDLFSENFYHKLPSDWFVVLTDIKNSTQAIVDGAYKNINVLAVSSIIAAQNACGEIEIPYIFGGDGALIFIPKEKLEYAKAALGLTKLRAREEFNLDLRVSMIPMKEVYEKGFEISIAKRKLSSTASIAMAKGSGIDFIESSVKSSDKYEISEIKSDTYNVYDGFECKWNPFPSKRGEFLTLIIKSNQKDNYLLYSNVMNEIFQIAPHLSFVNPDKKNISYSASAFLAESKMKYQGLEKYVKFFQGCVAMAFRTIEYAIRGESFIPLNDLTKNTDHIKFDNSLKMIIDVTKEQKNKILEFLDKYSQKGELQFGFYSNKEVLFTCYVRSMTDHIHFVDGGSGGYALASQQLKEKIIQNKSKVAS